MNILYTIQQQVALALKDLFELVLNPEDIQVQETRKEFQGEFTIVVFPFTRFSKKSPQETAELLGKRLQTQISDVVGFEVVKGFLNLQLSDAFWIHTLQDKPEAPPIAPKTVMVEYSSPNTNKPLHLGHVRNNLLGYSVSEILKANGNEVIKANLINDRGIHICKSMLAWEKWGNGEAPESSGMKGDHLVGKYYVIFDKEYKKEIAQLVKEGYTEEEASKKAPLIQEAQMLLRQWEAGDPKVIQTWQTMNSWVYAGFEKTYQALGVDFDKFYYESNTYLLGKKVVEEGLSKGVFFKKEDGSVWVDLSEEGLDEKLLLRGDGTSVYITQDLGTAEERFKAFHLDKLIYVVGNEQEYHFKVLSAIFKKLGRPWYNAIFHLSYGMVELPSGKMKSREGTVVDADDLLAEMLEEAAAETAKLGKIDEMGDEELQELYRKISLAALKFYILKADPKKQMLFNPAESIDLHGFTGPYIQYVYARMRSIMRKATEKGAIHPDIALQPEEKELLQHLYKQDEIVTQAAQNLSPALIANYIYELARMFNRFYDKCPVLKEPDENIRNFRIYLIEKTMHCLKSKAALLGIEMPDRM